MSEERKEVLSLLSEGRISIEEAERLLDALGSGGRGRRRGRRERGSRGGRRGFNGRIADAVDTAVRSALDGSAAAAGHDHVSSAVERERDFPVPEGSRLEVRNNRKHPGGGCITLRRGDGVGCRVDCEGPFEVLRVEETISVEWDYGDIEIEVPDTASEIKAWTHGGNVTVEDIRSPLDLMTLGGDIRITGLCHSGKARTMGGNVWLGVEALDPGTTSEVTTNHGDFFVTVGPELNAVVKVGTLSGDLTVEEGLGNVFDSLAEGGPRRGMPRNVAVEIGKDPRAAEVTLRTLHGNVVVEKTS